LAQKKKNHHHGDLRAALVKAGVDLMEENGIDGLTLRKCAARAGVSHAAPAHHFNGLISLKCAIVAHGHMVFASTMRSEMALAQPDPVAQLHAVCRGYLIFSKVHNSLFQLMFQKHQTDFSTITASVLTELTEHSSQSYGCLQQVCAPFENDKDNPNNIEITVWSLVHGFAVLFGDAKTPTTPTGEPPDFSVILAGLRLTPKPDIDKNQ